MAKGNDGNFLQHCIETVAARRLVEMSAAKALHIAITHGMKPFEPFEDSKGNMVRDTLLRKALDASRQKLRSDEPTIVTAYRKVKASDKHYPNTAELLRAIVGGDRLSGGIAETKPDKHQELVAAWSNSRVKPVHSSWRQAIDPGGALACPGQLRIPWLFTMDPMTYVENGADADDKLYRSDLEQLACVLSTFFGSGQPGIATLFVYSVGTQGRNRQRQYWNFVEDLAKAVEDRVAGQSDVNISRYWVQHNGGNRNLAGLLRTGIELTPELVSCGVRVWCRSAH